ncbi:MAG: outer membrane protein assembly factor BamA [Candidatus Magnetoovum sp. WYHC-5]|nr:outer membrane protein assembly factor BamA [Candidatus Magnetoovum sp. WYHC-5]
MQKIKTKIYQWLLSADHFLQICYLLVYILLIISLTAGSVYASTVKIANISVKGLRSISESELLYMFEIKEGEVLDDKKINNGIKTAFLKGTFDDIQVYKNALSGGDVQIVIVVKERPFIDKIEVDVDGEISKSDIKGLFQMKVGSIFSKELLENAVELLKEGLKGKGYPYAQVRPVYEIEPKTGKVFLKLSVFGGTPFIIRKFILNGSDDYIKKRFNIKVGDVYNESFVKSEIERVLKYLKKKGFYAGLDGTYSYDVGTGTLTINSGNRNKLKVVFNNNKAYADSELKDEMPFIAGQQSDDIIIEEGILYIKSKYYQKGYINVEVKGIVKKGSNVDEFIFDITQGDKYVVSDISIDGASDDEEEVRRHIKYKKDEPYNPDILDTEKDSVNNYFFNRGYPDAVTAVFKPTIDDSTKKVKIDINVKKGQRYIIKLIEVKGNKSFSEKEVLQTINIAKDTPFTEETLLNARHRVSYLYQHNGIMADISLNKKANGSNSTSITLVVNIVENRKFFFGKTIVKGNKRTKWEVFKRVFKYKTGEPFNIVMVFDAIRQLYQTGLFKHINWDIYNAEGNVKDVLLTVEEVKAGAIEYGLGYGTDDGFRGSVEGSYINLFGRNVVLETKGQASESGQKISLSYKEPWFLGEHYPFTTTLFFENRREKNTETGDTKYKIKKYSAVSMVEKQLTENVTGYLSYDFSLVSTYDVHPDVILSREDTGTLAISSIVPAFIFDTRNDPFSPTEGFYNGLNMKLASSVLLSETDFLKLSGHINYYKGVTKNLTIALSLKSGLAEGWNETREIPLVERFFLGGSTTIRGYKKDNLGPKGQDNNPTGGNAFLMGNIELRTKVYGDLGIVNFLDSGNVWQKIDEIEPTNLKYTAGMGIRYKTPFGPIRFDYGYKLNKEEGESPDEYHISIGQAF